MQHYENEGVQQLQNQQSFLWKMSESGSLMCVGVIIDVQHVCFFLTSRFFVVTSLIVMSSCWFSAFGPKFFSKYHFQPQLTDHSWVCWLAPQRTLTSGMRDIMVKMQFRKKKVLHNTFDFMKEKFHKNTKLSCEIKKKKRVRKHVDAHHGVCVLTLTFIKSKSM